jgi:hypothetical protein
MSKKLVIILSSLIILSIAAIVYLVIQLQIPKTVAIYNANQEEFSPLSASYCKIERTCGDLIGLDCNSAADGGYYYIQKQTNKIVAKCGGYCDGRECTNCPPKEWTCETY